MSITQTYVDPAIAANSGSGTSGDPYGDLQYALDTMTRDGTNGDQINIKSGTDEILTAALDLTSYGSPTYDAPLVLRGYDATPGDGGIGGIDGDGSYSMFANTALDYIILYDLHLHNSGANMVMHLDSFVAIINCEVDNSTNYGLDLNQFGLVANCYIHNIGSRGVSVGGGTTVIGNYFENGANDFVRAISAAAGCVAAFNIINIDGASTGIVANWVDTKIINNTIYSSSGTGVGINAPNQQATICNNYVEGFSGVGGTGISISVYTTQLLNNYYYNNSTNASITGTVLEQSGNTPLTASALRDPANGDFRVNGSLRAGSWPESFPEIALPQYLDAGALQRKEPLRIPRLKELGH